MIFRQIIHDDLGCASYLVGDDHAGVAAVVDPRYDIQEYLEFARYVGVTIEHVLETHTHADHVSGHGRLRAATGATIHIHRLAGAQYEHEPFDDGWELTLGRVLVRAIHTPGHRPEHTAFALIDTARGPEPWSVLTGDTLFVGDTARPDLAVEYTEGARLIYRSLRNRLLTLPGSTEVWPGHLGGSMCGGPSMDMKVSSTIEFERMHNELLLDWDERQFVERAVARLGPQPPNFQAIVALNRGPLLSTESEPVSLTPLQVEQMRLSGALLVDVRTDLEFDDAHIPGAVCIPALWAGFGSKLAWLADREQEVVLIGRDDDDARRAAKLGCTVGILNPAGRLHGGMTVWRQEERPVASTERISVERLAELLVTPASIQVLDVRERSEWGRGHIPGSMFTPYHDMRTVPEGLDPELPVAVICASGRRAATGASLLARLGAERVIHVAEGGVPSWERLGKPVERADPAVPA